MHINEERLNKNGCLMRIVDYVDNRNIVVEFQDEYKAKVKTSYGNFKNGVVRNPYYPTVFGVGISGNRYPIIINKKKTKEYETWRNMLSRCFGRKIRERQPAYKEVSCCEEWLNYEKFYEWLHNQENFDKWYVNERWAVDKDIILKGNKIYSPSTCCLVPQNVNGLFTKRDADRGKLPIGVKKNGKYFEANCKNSITGEHKFLGTYKTETEAFAAYKAYKESLIKKIANIEFENKNIISKCYEAMMKYEVEITD